MIDAPYRQNGVAIVRIANWLACIALLLSVFPARGNEVAISLGQSVVALNGPWKFHTGDNMQWAQSDLEDSDWETVDLTPVPNSHDGDVGLKNYVSGWSARGHRGYTGFAWYRLAVTVDVASNESLWLVGPADVDNSYQVYFNGHLVGGIGDFTRDPPSTVAIQPRLFALPRDWWMRNGSALSGIIAFRVVLSKASGPSVSADGGGVHIAPLLGTEKGAGDHYRLEWLQTVEGYLVDAVEPCFFLGLAIMALCLLPFDPHERFYPWLAASLVLLALARVNQPLFFLWQFETFHDFVLWRLVVVDALTFGAWTLTWLHAFAPAPGRKTMLACTLLTVSYAISRILSTSVLIPALPPGVLHFFGNVLQVVRLAFLCILLFAAYWALRQRTLLHWVGLVAMLLASVGIFASELSILGVPGIWFPYGIGVSRTEYAYAVFYGVLFVHLLMRLWRFAPARSTVQELDARSLTGGA